MAAIQTTQQPEQTEGLQPDPDAQDGEQRPIDQEGAQPQPLAQDQGSETSSQEATSTPASTPSVSELQAQLAAAQTEARKHQQLSERRYTDLLKAQQERDEQAAVNDLYKQEGNELDERDVELARRRVADGARTRNGQPSPEQTRESELQAAETWLQGQLKEAGLPDTVDMALDAKDSQEFVRRIITSVAAEAAKPLQAKIDELETQLTGQARRTRERLPKGGVGVSSEEDWRNLSPEQMVQYGYAKEAAQAGS